MKTSRDVLMANFARYGLRPPVIHQGWFSETVPQELPEKICFAHLDGDLYESIKVSLDGVYPRLSKGAVCVIDDYTDPAVYNEWGDRLPGVKKACDEFIDRKSVV